MTPEANRLRAAREAAGFATAQEAATRFGWKYPTYSGHENGSRGMRQEALRVYSRAFKVDVLWLMEGLGKGPGGLAEPAPPAFDQPGFAEPEVSPYLATRPGQERVMSALAAELTPGLRHRQLYTVNRACPAYAVLAGDVLVIGTPEARRPGDIVVATLALPGPSDGRTVLRQAIGDALVAPVGHALSDEGDRSAGVLGTVAAVIRPPA
jgi:hypothetical protein